MSHVWRIENKYQIGLYNARLPVGMSIPSGARSVDYALFEELKISLWTSERQPSPDSDQKLGDWWRKIYDDYKSEPWQFGFSSLKQLKHWVHKKKARQLLSKWGLKAVRYNVSNNHFKRGETQAVFMKCCSIKLEERNLGEL